MKERQGIIELDKIDKKILFQLDLDSRQPISLIAKKLKLSRIVVEYRMKKLEEAGIIRSYVGFVDPYKFGLVSWKTYINFQNLTKEKEEAVIQYLNKVPNLWWVIRTTGAFDLMFCVLAKNNFEYYKTLTDFQQKFNEVILDIAVTNHINSHWFTRNYFTKEQGDFIGNTFTKEPIIEKLDKIDVRILRIIAANCRKSVVEIAKELKITPRMVSYRLKELKKKEVIVNYRLNMDVTKFGYSYYKVLLSLKDFTRKDINSLIQFFKQHPNFENCSLSYGPWDIEFELEVKNHAHFNEIMMTLRETFPRIIRKFEYVQIYQELRHDNNFIEYMGID